MASVHPRWEGPPGVGAAEPAASEPAPVPAARPTMGQTLAGDARLAGHTQFGLSRNNEIAAGAFYLGGLLGEQPRLRETGLLLGEALFAAQAVTGALNFAVSEQRPKQGGAIRYFHSGGSSASIHMTNAMALACVLDHQLAHAGSARTRRALRWLRPAVYAIPALTGLQRVRSDQHFLWNVVLGGGASLYVTSAVLAAHEHETGAGDSLPRAAPRLALGWTRTGHGGAPALLLGWSW